MLNIPIQLHPYGDSSRARELQRLTIANTGGTREVGQYAVCLYTGERLTAEAEIRDWPRLERDAAELVGAALKALGHC